MRVVVDNGPSRARQPRRRAPSRRLSPAPPALALRAATAADAPRLHALIMAHAAEGHLLPRALDELTVRAPRFVVAVKAGTHGEEIVGCAELASLSQGVAEVRSLAVSGDARHLGLGRRMVDELSRRARLDGFTRLCAFAHDPRFFVRLGFSIVPHTWVPEKIGHDCAACALFRQCGQYAVILDLRAPAAVTGSLAKTAGGGPVVAPRV